MLKDSDKADKLKQSLPPGAFISRLAWNWRYGVGIGSRIFKREKTIEERSGLERSYADARIVFPLNIALKVIDVSRGTPKKNL